MDNNTEELKHRMRGKVGNRCQVGGIELAVLDNGPARGSRIAWIDTGAGLRYKVLLDRGMDIAEAFYQQHSLAWMSHSGPVNPQPMSDRGIDWLRTFGGGLMTTCGLSHAGGPEEDTFGSRGLHGRISNTPAELIQVDQPDPLIGKMDFCLVGEIFESQVFGPHLLLRRKISGALGNPTLRVEDEVVNRGNTQAPHMLLYHLNLGWPLLDEGAEIVWSGNWHSRDQDPNNRIFNLFNNFKACPAPRADHAGSGEDVAFIDVAADDAGRCFTGVYNPRLGFALQIAFEKKQLPWLINWQHWGTNEYVMALEPGTNPPIGQAKAREEGTLIFLEPGESRSYRLDFEVLHEPTAIETLTKWNSI
ncbi:MAG: aldose 1-epimerase family protein [Lunatimonas sp.]|uniref:aldose 1-epimerase family protein n=1 Tax=Lunatimonas sp. TaxID=2060141 RepID=UPI00263B0961|nr:aldose 1-epimerase family protein [Lunatimonas sp.]MCC5937851.1 aldose 1-epimerase family protein [Lunatimonas sp.]